MTRSRKVILLVLLFIVGSPILRADNIYIMNAPGYNTAEQSLIDVLISLGHNVTVNTNNLGSLPVDFTSQCQDPVNGYEWLCFFGDNNFSGLIPQITTFIQSGGKVYYQYEVSCCTTSSSSAAAVVSGVTGLAVTTNSNDYIALSFGGAGWGAIGMGGCVDLYGNAYKGLDGLPVANQLQANAVLNGGSPDISVCLNFGFFFAGADIPGNTGGGALLGVGDVNMWHDGGEPGTPINADAVSFFFPGVNAPCTMVPECGDVCPFSNVLGPNTNVCFGETLTLDATSDNATYLWQDNSVGPTFDVTAAGQYWVEVSSDLGTCSDTIDVVLTQIIVQTSNDTTICLGQSANLSASGGTTYLWSPPQTLANPGAASTLATPQNTTTYTVTVSDSGCSESADVQVTVEPGEVNYTVSTSAMVCDVNGELTVGQVTGSWPPFTVEIDNNLESDSALIPASPGIHTVKITDSIGCLVVEDVEVADDSYSLVMDIDSVDPLCDLTGSISVVSVQNAAGNPSYFLNGNAQATPEFTSLSQGIYQVTASDDNGCVGNQNVNLVLQSNSISYVASSIDPVCLTPGSVSVSNVGNGIAPYIITIDNTVVAEDELYSAGVGNYAVSITDSAGCNVNEVVALELQENDITLNLTTLTAICETPGKLVSVDVSGANAPYEITVDEVPLGAFAMDLPAGQHSLTLVDEDGCIHTESFEITMINHTIAGFETNPSVGEWPLDVTFTNTSVNADSFYWDFGNGLTSEEADNQISYLEVGSYLVHLLAIDTENGCIDTISARVDVITPGTIYIPSGFTPDYDGVNDVFGLYGEGIADDHFVFQVYDRWGEVIWESTTPGEFWTGSVHNGEHFSPDGVYVYHVQYRFLSSPDIRQLGGHVLLMR